MPISGNPAAGRRELISDSTRADFDRGRELNPPQQVSTAALAERNGDPRRFAAPPVAREVFEADRRDREIAERLGFSVDLENIKMGLRSREEALPPLREPTRMVQDRGARNEGQAAARVNSPENGGRGASGAYVERFTVRSARQFRTLMLPGGGLSYSFCIEQIDSLRFVD